jgi:hypothetical protein
MSDTILASLYVTNAPHLPKQAERCVVYSGQLPPNCFGAAPEFRDPANLDYRLKPTSPYRKKARDGGDIGCRFTPEMLEMLEKALELRKKGIIKF